MPQDRPYNHVYFQTQIVLRKHINFIYWYHLLIDIGLEHYCYKVEMVVPSGDSIQADFLHSAYQKIAVLQDQLSVLQDSKTWTPQNYLIDRLIDFIDLKTNSEKSYKS